MLVKLTTENELKLKGDCGMPIVRVFAAFCCGCEVKMQGSTEANTIISETHCYTINAAINRVWQLTFNFKSGQIVNVFSCVW